MLLCLVKYLVRSTELICIYWFCRVRQIYLLGEQHGNPDPDPRQVPLLRRTPQLREADQALPQAWRWQEDRREQEGQVAHECGDQDILVAASICRKNNVRTKEIVPVHYFLFDQSLARDKLILLQSSC